MPSVTGRKTVSCWQFFEFWVIFEHFSKIQSLRPRLFSCNILRRYELALVGNFIWNSCQFSQRLQIKCGWSKGTANCLCCILIVVHSNIAAPRTWRGFSKKAINNACAEMLFVSPWYLTGLWWCPRWWEEKQSLTRPSSPCGSVTRWHHWWEQTCSLHFGYSEQNRHGALQKKSTLFHSVLYSTFLQVGILRPISGRSLLARIQWSVIRRWSQKSARKFKHTFFFFVLLVSAVLGHVDETQQCCAVVCMARHPT